MDMVSFSVGALKIIFIKNIYIFMQKRRYFIWKKVCKIAAQSEMQDSKYIYNNYKLDYFV